jgi:hypothetical protein
VAAAERGLHQVEAQEERDATLREVTDRIDVRRRAKPRLDRGEAEGSAILTSPAGGSPAWEDSPDTRYAPADEG